MAKPLAVKSLTEGDSLVVKPKKYRLKAGQKLPGSVQSSLRLAQGALGKEAPTKPRWFERRKLGIDRSEVWSRP